MQRCLILVFTLAVSQFSCIAYSQQGNERRPARPLESREQWRMIYVGGSNIGYVHDVVETVNRAGKEVVVNQHTSVFDVTQSRRNGIQDVPSDTRSKIMIQTEETIDGDVLAFRYQVQNPPLATTLKEGRVADGQLRIQTEANGRVAKTTRDFPIGVKGPAYADRMLLKQPLKVNETRVITTFDPRSAQVDTIRFEARDFENTLFQDGTEKRLLHVLVSHSTAPNLVFHEFFDAEGHSWKTTVPSQDMVVYTTSRDTALKLFRDIKNP
ncbi:hypothetical protein [Gimesia algae]|uniref:Uncharacterized protein n=1 Tax=Gimesia algae TaxID=2527971 RepID=A0A517VHP3_9PLAN|nr:hypothetical protein [Gimesia algae]QDT92482.1 hypothetical protein Pan161_41490 [Gimesia algae]